MSRPCPVCGTTVLAGEAFCEQCGHDMSLVAPAAAPPSAFAVAAAAGRSSPCTACGSDSVGSEGYCENCGMLQPTGRDHMEIELGPMAGVSDRGLRHSRNEDAIVAVVCDGVSTSPAVSSAMASSLRLCRRPRSLTPAIGPSSISMWSRPVGCSMPQFSQ